MQVRELNIQFIATGAKVCLCASTVRYSYFVQRDLYAALGHFLHCKPQKNNNNLLTPPSVNNR